MGQSRQKDKHSTVTKKEDRCETQPPTFGFPTHASGYYVVSLDSQDDIISYASSGITGQRLLIHGSAFDVN